jgi:cytochrome oxidase Cu insertion factor (SCO1/SenC/PrrC family)
MEMRTLRIFLWALAALALVAGTYIYYGNLNSADKQRAGIVDIGGPFSMTNQNGQAVSI